MKIIQLLKLENDYTWQGRLLGLADNGVTYELDNDGRWVEFIPAVTHDKSHDTRQGPPNSPAGGAGVKWG